MTRCNNAQLAVLLALLLCGCATYSRPREVSLEFKECAETQSDNEVRVSAVLLSAAESSQFFNATMTSNGIQPIWLEIENGSDERLILTPLGLDPDYFGPGEAAYRTRRFGEQQSNDKLRYFLENHIPLRIPAQTTVSGFAYTNFDPGAKAFSARLIGDQRSYDFDFVQLVPGFKADFLAAIISDEDVEEKTDLDLDGLRAYLAGFTCCVLGGDKETPGDPANLVIVGPPRHVLSTLVRQGWDLTETIRLDSSLQTAFSSIFGSRYRTSPISALYLFGRPQDAGLQKARSTVDERNHMRLWEAPVTFEGVPVWVGQISRDIGVKFSSKTLVTHKVDPMVDEARLYVLFDLLASGYVDRAGFVTGVGLASIDAPRYNYTGDPYFTDGLRVVVILNETQVQLDNVEFLPWEQVPSMSETVPRLEPQNSP